MKPRRMLWRALLGCTLLVVGAYAGRRVYADGAPTTQPLFYAGVLEEDGQLVTGPRTIALRIFDADAEGNQLCESSTEGVPVETGRFRMEVSEECVAALRTHPDAWVAVTFQDGSGTPHEIPGRTKVGAVPFALEAQRASEATGALAGRLVPPGMIAMFAGACPAGWVEFQALRGRVPRGEPAGNAAALDQGGNDNAIAVAHTHGVSGQTASAGNHAHGVSGSTANAGGHSHDTITTANFGACPGSGIVRVTWNGDGADACAYVTGHGIAIGDHAHTFNANSASAGPHTHAVELTTASAGSAGTGMNMQQYREVIFCAKQ